MEGPQQDPLDSSIERRWQAYIGDTNNDPESVRIAASMGIHLHNCKDLTFTDCRHVVRSRPAYVLCLCDCPDNEYLLAGGKTAVIEIADVEAFALRLQRADNRLGFATAGPVDYGCVSFDARQPAARPDPFLKGEAFSPEREIRIVWEAADEAIEPIFCHACDDGSLLSVRFFRGVGGVLSILFSASSRRRLASSGVNWGGSSVVTSCLALEPASSSIRLLGCAN